jgi:hypothetical protein
VEWWSVLPKLTATHAGVGTGNVGLVSILHELTHVRLAVPLAIVVAGGCLLKLARTRVHGASRSGDEVLFAVAAGGAATPVVYPIFWVHYGVLVVPACFVCWRWAKLGARWVVALAVIAMSALVPSLSDAMWKFAIGIDVTQVALFVFTLAAWADERSRAIPPACPA